MTTHVEKLLLHERALVACALAALTLLAWIYIWRGAGMGMSALEMTRLALFPHRADDAMTGMAMAMPFAWLSVVAMWWAMMIAMMVPGAAPLVLLYGMVRRKASPGTGSSYGSSLFVVVGYLLAWLAFSIAAATLQWLLVRGGVVSAMFLSSSSAALSAAVLLAAGLYQLSPLKRVCLVHCRGPVQFLSAHWRPGRIGALVMGFRHGVWCVGCCWLLMLLLFVGGVMNVAWIAALTLLVLVEKIAPGGAAAGKVAGALLLAWGVAMLFA
jgi:predicted metal-binding membrane protein